MGALQKTKDLCKQRNVKIRTLECDLGFGNGYIGSKTKDDLPFDRVAAIAEYFKVPIDYFLSDDISPDTVHEEGIEKALELYKQYMNAIPEIQAAVESLLKSQQPGS